jgi:hypothetical protein
MNVDKTNPVRMVNRVVTLNRWIWYHDLDVAFAEANGLDCGGLYDTHYGVDRRKWEEERDDLVSMLCEWR